MRAPPALRSQSRIVDSDGSVLGQLADEQGVLTAEVVMDPAPKHFNAQSSFNGWRQPSGWGWAGRHVMIRPNLSRPAVVRQGLEMVALVGLATADRPVTCRCRPSADGDGI